MASPIVSLLGSLPATAPVTRPVVGPVGEDFVTTLSHAAKAVEARDRSADTAVSQFAQGFDGRLHETLLTVEKADIALRLMVSVRNRVVEAYREVMRMGA